MWLVIAAAGVFVFAVVVYVMFMIFLPEWVGITGKVAKEAERSHQGEAGPDSLMQKLQGRSHYLEGDKDRNPNHKKD